MYETLIDALKDAIICTECQMPFDPTIRGNYVIRTLKNQGGDGSTPFIFPKCPSCEFIDQTQPLDIYQPQ